MKRLFSLLLMLLSLFATACGSSESELATDSSNATGPVVTVFFAPS